ncbi:MAG: PIG-L deacetylase family protein [Planctomycetota bacterium]
MSERSPFPVTLKELARGPVLLLAPHPDDEVLGCGLTCHKHALQGDRVHVVVAFDGALGNLGNEALSPSEFVAARQEETRASCRLLGFEEPLFLGYPENHVPGENDVEHAVSQLAGLVAGIRPRTVFAPWPGEHQIDHATLAAAVDAALDRAAAEHDVRPDVWLYEVWSALVPTHVVDVTDVFELKGAALRLHRTQYEHTDLLHHMGGLNAHRALYVEPRGARYAEAFRLR